MISVLILLTQAQDAIERYRRLEYPPKAENFDKGWKERVGLEFEIVHSADLKSLRAALKDSDPFVRAIAARALGIRADKESVQVLAALANADVEHTVRVRAVEALGFLKMKSEIIETAKKDIHLSVRWAAQLAAEEAASETDYAAPVRQAYAAGIKPEAMGAAKVGEPAPDFSLPTTDGKLFKLSDVQGKKPVAIYFAAFDG